MKPQLKFIFVFTGILLLSALLAPLLFDFLPFKFERIFNRLVMIFSLAAAGFFVRFRRQTFLDYGLAWKPASLSLLLLSFAGGMGVLLFLDALKIAFGAGQWAPAELASRQWGMQIVKALAAALLIGFLEECFFRGFIFNALKSWGKIFSLLLTNLFYSVVHFVDHESPLIGPDPTFWDSLRLVAAPFQSLRHWNEIWPGVLGLFIFGLILSGLLLRAGSLYAPIGLHAGCVFFLKLDGLFFHFLNRASLFWGSSKTYDGILGWVFFGVFYFVFHQMTRKNCSVPKRGAALGL